MVCIILCLQPSLQLPVNSNLFDTFGGGGVGGGTAGLGNLGAGSPMVVAQISSSCPANVKNERSMMAQGEYSGGASLATP